jgi:hypothetical protein
MTTHEQHTDTMVPKDREPLDYPAAATDSSPTRGDQATSLDPVSTPASQETQPPLETVAPTDAAPTDSSTAANVPPRAQVASEPQAATTPTDSSAAARPADVGDGRDLFADDELAGLRARWDNVQAAFVDDPRECVQKADGLVSDVVEQLTAGFTHARSRLEEQWARGEEASTEDLRVALKQYREFFQRLLAV